jgi:hypothetical protein
VTAPAKAHMTRKHAEATAVGTIYGQQNTKSRKLSAREMTYALVCLREQRAGKNLNTHGKSILKDAKNVTNGHIETA